MIVPPAMLIESAQDMLKTLDPKVRSDQMHELGCARGDVNPDFADGYELGLQTARVLLMCMPKAVMNGVEI